MFMTLMPLAHVVSCLQVRQISRLLCIFISGVSFGSDLELHLNFFVDCRRFFIRIDDVKFVLVTGVLALVQVSFLITF